MSKVKKRRNRKEEDEKRAHLEKIRELEEELKQETEKYSEMEV